MNKTRLIGAGMVMGLLIAGSAWAGPRHYAKAYSSKNSVIPARPVKLNVPQDCECFASGPQYSLYGAGVFSGGHGIDDGIGAGISAGYFFTENVGVELGATWFDNHSAIHAFDASAVLRYPIPSTCIAPYIYGGVGLHANSVTQFTTHVGAGVDIRFEALDCAGVFVDGRYVFGEESDDYSILRAGIRTAF